MWEERTADLPCGSSPPFSFCIYINSFVIDMYVFAKGNRSAAARQKDCVKSGEVYGCVPFQISVPKELVALMSANREGEAPDPEDSTHKIYSFSQNVSALLGNAAPGLGPDLCRSRSPHAFDGTDELCASLWVFATLEMGGVMELQLWEGNQCWCWWCLLVFFGIPRKAKFEFWKYWNTQN